MATITGCRRNRKGNSTAGTPPTMVPIRDSSMVYPPWRISYPFHSCATKRDATAPGELSQ